MKFHHVVALSVSVLFAGNALAAGEEALFKKNACAACHNPTNKTVGPALKDIAAKYKGDATAPEKLAAKVRSGGKGSFGTIAMPPTNAAVTDSDIKTLVEWILAR